LANKDLYIAAM